MLVCLYDGMVVCFGECLETCKIDLRKGWQVMSVCLHASILGCKQNGLQE